MKKFIVAIATAAMLMSSAAYAAEWNFYGNVRLWTFYNMEDTTSTTEANNVEWDLSPYSRIGANIKVSDTLAARFEYGSSDSVNLRLIYGEWNFGPGSLVIGQDWAPTIMAGSNQVWKGYALGGVGEMGGVRKPQLKLKIGGLRFALIEPSTSVLDGDGITGATGSTALLTNTEVKLPQIAAKYIFDMGNWSARVVGAYQTFDTTSNNVEDDVTAYMLGLGADVTFGAFTLYGSVHGGDNIGNLYNAVEGDDKLAGTTSVNSLAYQDQTTGEVVDVESIAYRLVGVYKYSDMISFEVGYGFGSNEYDKSGSTEDEVESYYINMPITIAPGVILTPEIGALDYKEAETEDLTYVGAHWRINF